MRGVFAVSPFIGEPFYLTDIYSALNKVKGVIDTKRVNITRKLGANYSPIRFDIGGSTSADGRYLSVPTNVVLELKFPNSDIKGAIT